ncbi:hypothetical protein [Methylobacterium nigriterrae]|uniref:hypothetical protein n=1 Tax=Methylobacterium nigriterrae TaxID=3127512 RepID=UPI0030137D32
MNLLAVILICTATTAPADCSRETALDVQATPVSSPFNCMMTGQVTPARDPELLQGHYAKTVCERRRLAEPGNQERRAALP